MRAVLFDLDETLFDRSACMRETASIIGSELASTHNIDADKFSSVFLESDNCHTSKKKFAEAVLNEFESLEISEIDFVRWRDDVAMNCGSLFPETTGVLNILKESNYLMGIVSNASRKNYQYEKIARLGLLPYMKSVVISDETMKKPNDRIFIKALKEMEVSAEQAVFVGDNPIADIGGASRMGMKTVFKISRRYGSFCPQADHCIDSLDELQVYL